MTARAPVRLASSRVWRPFTGGRELDRLRGLPDPADGHLSEEWILSTTRASLHDDGDPRAGLSTAPDLPGEPSLRDLVGTDPDAYLGSEHAARYGPDLAVLAKLIDSRDRLALQVHPDKAAARRYFNSPLGKTECWHVLAVRPDAPEPPRLYIGFREGATRERWRDCFLRDDVPGLFAMLHAFTPQPGQTWLVPGGVPHAAGAGLLLAEVQEATDITLRVETRLPSGVVITREQCHLGIGVEAMLDCFHFDPTDEAEARRRFLLEPHGDVLAGPPDTDCFALRRCRTDGVLDLPADPGRFAGLYVTAGEGRLEWPGGEAALAPHAQFFLPASRPGCRLVARSSLEGILIYPPVNP